MNNKIDIEIKTKNSKKWLAEATNAIKAECKKRDISFFGCQAFVKLPDNRCFVKHENTLSLTAYN
jgi:hypothetical protein